MPSTRIVALLFLCLIGFNSSFGQQNYYVDIAGVNAPGNGSVGSPYLTLTYALADLSISHTHVAGDTITVNAGTYSDANIALVYNDINIFGAGMGLTVFNGGGFFMSITGSNVYVKGVSIQNYQNAGAIDISSNSTLDSTYVTFEDCAFFDNRTFIGFDADPEGGALYIERGSGIGVFPASVDILNCQFVSNVAEDGEGGGAIYIEGESQLDIIGSRFLCNNDRLGLTTYEGGAIYFSNSSGWITDSYFSGNKVFDQQGGAIIGDDATGQKSIVIKKSVFTKNRAREGGAVFVYNNYDLYIENSLIFDNDMVTGFGNGGVINSDGSNNNVVILNSTIADNNNTGGTGDPRGVVNSNCNTFTIDNSIIWGNDDEDIFDFGVGAVVVSNSVVDLTGGTAYTNGGGNSNANPSFIGAPNYTLQVASIAIGLANGVLEPIDDITGFTRASATSGAYESGATTLTFQDMCSVVLPCIVEAGDAVTICAGDSAVIGGSPSAFGGNGNPFTYSWLPATNIDDPTLPNPTVFPTVTTTNASPGDTTTYYLTVTENGCSSTTADSTTVNVIPRPIADAGNASYDVCLGDSVQIGTSPVSGATYSWTPTTGLSNPNIANPNARLTVGHQLQD
jgi:hypothetical protein